MPVRIKLPAKGPKGRAFLPSTTVTKAIAGTVVALLLVAVILAWAIYSKYARLADQKLAEGLFPKSSLVYAAPEDVGVGDQGTPTQFAQRLRESGYAEDARNNPVGWYHLRSDAIEIFPGPQSYGGSEPAVLRFRKGAISHIIALSDNTQRTEYMLEPKLLSSVFDKDRVKRRLVKYDDIPPLLVHAVISAEDKRFFQHSGLDPVRITKSVVDDLRHGSKFEGASTLTQQLARMLWLNNNKTWRRKFAEMMITIHLERKLTKEQIFEYYANDVPLGRRGTFDIRGLGEASQAYFGVDIRNLTLDQAATLAGLIQEPSFRNPVRWPGRAKARRNVVLKMMLENGYISQGQYEQACDQPLSTSKGIVQTDNAPFFLDIVNERLGEQFQDRDFQSSGSKIYTTLDPALQDDAAAAVANGMAEIREFIAKRRRKGTVPDQDPQVALICLDPHTGEVKALVGGTNYAISQYDHALAKRPPGSAFKPFVYATAINSGLAQQPNPITASSMFEDVPRVFQVGNSKPYMPSDYHHSNSADAPPVSVGEALAKSLNVPSVEIAEAVGYKNVVDLAKQAGLEGIGATPAMALGTYDVTPLALTGAYTIFANNGILVEPRLLLKVVDGTGSESWTSKPETKQILDPRVAYIIVNMMKYVLQGSGTGAAVRARGFTLPAAGKTGTEHDAWFAGFTTKLLTVVWIGLDNYHDLKIEGAHAALPIWADFMTRAHKHRAYRDPGDFTVPDGVASALIDPESGDLATTTCPQTTVQYYLTGTQPVQFCPLHPGAVMEQAGYQTAPNGITQQLPTAPAMNVPRPPGAPPQQQPGAPVIPGQNPAMAQQPPGQPGQPQPDQQAQQQQQQPEKKKGFFGRLKGIFK